MNRYKKEPGAKSREAEIKLRPGAGAKTMQNVKYRMLNQLISLVLSQMDYEIRPFSLDKQQIRMKNGQKNNVSSI